MPRLSADGPEIVEVDSRVLPDGTELTSLEEYSDLYLGGVSAGDLLRRLKHSTVKTVYRGGDQYWLDVNSLTEEDIRRISWQDFIDWLPTSGLIRIDIYGEQKKVDAVKLYFKLQKLGIPISRYWLKDYAPISGLDYVCSEEGKRKLLETEPWDMQPEAFISLRRYADQESINYEKMKRIARQYKDIFLLEKKGFDNQTRYRREDIERMVNHVKAKAEQKRINREHKERIANMRREEKEKIAIVKSKQRLVKDFPDIYEMVDGEVRVRARQGEVRRQWK